MPPAAVARTSGLGWFNITSRYGMLAEFPVLASWLTAISAKPRSCVFAESYAPHGTNCVHVSADGNRSRPETRAREDRPSPLAPVGFSPSPEAQRRSSLQLGEQTQRLQMYKRRIRQIPGDMQDLGRIEFAKRKGQQRNCITSGTGGGWGRAGAPAFRHLTSRPLPCFCAICSSAAPNSPANLY